MSELKKKNQLSKEAKIFQKIKIKINIKNKIIF
jgi:hypothetical protein